MACIKLCGCNGLKDVHEEDPIICRHICLYNSVLIGQLECDVHEDDSKYIYIYTQTHICRIGQSD